MSDREGAGSVAPSGLQQALLNSQEHLIHRTLSVVAASWAQAHCSANAGANNNPGLPRTPAEREAEQAGQK